jgi:antitoxin component of RelBE/YafQ-DinJ toxin-antitoxin module
MKENKSVQIKFRLTASQKEQVDKYCESANLNVSEVMRLALTELLNKNGGK